MPEAKEISSEQAVEEIRHIIDSRKEFFLANYPVIRLAFQEYYDTPELDTWRHEACLCLFFGLYQAAITATNHLLESFLKYALVYYYSRPWRNHDQDVSTTEIMQILQQAHQKVDNLNLENTIDRACSLGIIAKSDKAELKRLKGPFRNAYSHASKEKLLGNTPIKMIPGHITEEGQFEMETPIEVPVGSNPLVAWMAQLEHAKAMAMPYFLYLDGLIRRSLKRLYAEEPPARSLEPE